MSVGQRLTSPFSSCIRIWPSVNGLVLFWNLHKNWMSIALWDNIAYGKINLWLQNLHLFWKNYKDQCGAFVGASLSAGSCNWPVPCGVLHAVLWRWQLRGVMRLSSWGCSHFCMCGSHHLHPSWRNSCWEPWEWETADAAWPARKLKVTPSVLSGLVPNMVCDSLVSLDCFSESRQIPPPSGC